jgi:hypothetical protein
MIQLGWEIVFSRGEDGFHLAFVGKGLGTGRNDSADENTRKSRRRIDGLVELTNPDKEDNIGDVNALS